MSSKAALKAVRSAIDAKKFADAAEQAKSLVSQDPQNYHGHVFLGLANDKLNKVDESEAAYLAATQLKSADRTAWQGLISLYERQGSQRLGSYRQAVLNYGQILAESDDQKERCQDMVDKYTKLAKKFGSKAEYKQALEIQLPTYPLYDFLEGRLPHPSHTYLRLIELTESEEKEYINREIGERRTRLGARIEQVTLEVKREAFKKSKLEDLYRGIIDWSNEDAVRREYEEKLILRGCDELEVLPVKFKKSKRKEIIRASHDMIIIQHPFQAAWDIYLEWSDLGDYSKWDVTILRKYIEFFPESGFGKVLKGFLTSELSPFPQEKTEEEDDDDEEKASAKKEMEVIESQDAAADRLILMVEGLESARTSCLAHRIMSDLYLSIEEHESAIEVARKGLLNAKELVRRYDLPFQNTFDAINIILANSLIHYQSPRHHPEAKSIFEEIIQRKPTSTTCLLGVGLILKVDEDYSDAIGFLQRALERDNSNIKIRGELSWCKALNGDLETGLNGLQDALERLNEEQPENKTFKAELLYGIGHCQWELNPSTEARKDRKGAYASFLAAIKTNMNFAPAYTSLGLFYAEYKKDKARAHACFHKAFELSSLETEAAERLARGFADVKEWDLVEAVAQRVVDSGKARPAPGSKRKGYSWPYAALGTVQINKQQYSKSIVSFQASLRIAPGDYHSWVGLAESYHHSGRYIAATKAFQHAQELESTLSSKDKEHVWFARYMTANVKRELGDYDSAIAAYEDVLNIRPHDIGNTIALLQTLVESSWKSLHSGLFNEAADRAAKAILAARPLVEVGSNIFNLWKAVGDACATFSYVKKKMEKLPVSDCKTLLATRLDPAALDIMTDVDGIGQDWLDSADNDEGTSSSPCHNLSILAYKRSIHVSAHDRYAQAAGWYNLGWAEYRADRGVQPDQNTKSKKPSKFLKAAIRCFKRAIELEAGNSEFWNALGVATARMSPRVSQHAFVRSLHLNDRSAQVWANLGALYLINNDPALANEAFTRAQSTDPDYSQAWVGQGILAETLYADLKETRGLYEHAFDISHSSDMIPKRQYALTLFDHLLSDPSASNEVSQLIQPFFALHQLCAQNPSDLPFMHLLALLAERMGETADAESSLEAVCAGMETEYDETESVAALVRFAQANSDFARVLLARHEYERAAEKAEMALTLTGDDDVEKSDPEACTKLRLSAHLTAGLAYYFTKSMDQSIDMFRDALQEADNAPDVVCLLAQVLWAKGGEEEKSVARQQLFDCVESHPDHLGAITLLGAIALVDNDKDVIKAVESDLQNMVTRDDIDIHDRAKLLKLLTMISAKGFNEDATLPEETRLVKEATSAIMLAPGQPQGWMELSDISESAYPAEMAIKRALRCVPPHGNLDADDLSKAHAQTGLVGDAFRSIMVAPWRQEGWDELNHTLSSAAA
ncbi:hypothetical protein N7456_000255 [Penicillium angulare]|uniref:Superkiller protein 3 n=1 Tax=Penicillium angulare TaxID=116970 RepID=A0A9W9KQR6_9EURO|nr:hypothetical protein N7456_000255 [Penicillium angulare]